jgi:hypothetical protein
MQHHGSCHCGKVSFTVTGEFKEGMTCNCSICHRKGTVLEFVPEQAFQLKTGEGHLTDYQFGKKSIHHTFCATCGVTAFASGSMPTGEKMKAINLRCLDGIALERLEITFVDGKSF